jgi:hypothetical protein
MTRRGRTAVALLIILCGIAIIAGSRLGWLNHYGHVPAAGIKNTAFTGLLHLKYELCSTYFNSVSFVVLLCGALVIVGGVIASRLLAGLFSLIALLAGGLWLGLYISHYKGTSLPYQDVHLGAWLALGGAIVALISSPFLRRRRLL